MNFASVVCANGHPTVITCASRCKICKANLYPLKILTKSSRLPVHIVGYHIKYDDLACIRFEDGTTEWYQPNELIILNCNSERAVSIMFRNGIATGK